MGIAKYWRRHRRGVNDFRFTTIIRLSPIDKFMLKKLILASLLFCCSVVVASAADPAETLSQLLSAVSSFEGKVSQVTVADDGEMLDETEGTITVKRPGLFRLHTQTPYEQIIVSDRETIWNYDPDLEQVIIKPYDDQLEQSPAALLLSGDLSLIKRDYDVQLTSASGSEKDFLLIPHTTEQGFEKLEIVFDGSDPVKIVSHDTLGQISTFVFSGRRINHDIAAKTFTFKTPAGVEEVYTDDR